MVLSTVAEAPTVGNKKRPSKPRPRRSDENINRVSESMERDPQTSIRHSNWKSTDRRCTELFARIWVYTRTDILKDTFANQSVWLQSPDVTCRRMLPMSIVQWQQHRSNSNEQKPRRRWWCFNFALDTRNVTRKGFGIIRIRWSLRKEC